MKRATEIALLEELHGLKNSKEFYLDEAVHKSPVGRYMSDDRFKAEKRDIFRKLPLIAAHSSELPEAGSFMTRDLAGLPLLLTRDKEMNIHAFLNVCRHRGSKLESELSGCKRAFSCPYHAWTWNNEGNLKGVPHQKQGFPDLDRDAYKLKRLPSVEQAGMIWVIANPNADPDFESYLSPILNEFEWFGMPDMAIAASNVITIKANWKMLVEGGIEAYHFKVAHRHTIGPHFLDNLSSYRELGAHMRSVLPKNSLKSLADMPQEDWNIREHSNVLYNVFPLDQFLLMEDHVAWISARPISADETELRLSTMAPKEDVTPEKMSHWKRNHQITVATLMEDFEVNAAAQSGLESGANEFLTFGRYEGALESFNKTVESFLSETNHQ